MLSLAFCSSSEKCGLLSESHDPLAQSNLQLGFGACFIRFYPDGHPLALAINVEYCGGRQGAFFLLTLGESIIQILGKSAAVPLNHSVPHFTMLVCAFIVTIALSYQYFDLGRPLVFERHAMGRGTAWQVAFIWLQVPYSCAVLFWGIAVEAYLDELGELYEAFEEQEDAGEEPNEE